MSRKPSRRDTLALMAASAGAALTEFPAAAQTADTQSFKAHGIAMHGAPKYPPGFAHFNYVNANAPKGGSLYIATVGGFNNLNPFVLKGTTPAALAAREQFSISSLTFDHFAERSHDEPFSMYGLIATSIETPRDRAWVAFEISEKARFHDGTPVTPEDAIFSLQVLKAKGRPIFRSYFADIDKAEKTGPRGVRFLFRTAQNRELPLIVAGDLPIIPRHFWQNREFDSLAATPILGGGPYRVGAVNFGRSIEFERVRDYWAADLPVGRGRNNFDLIRLDYYKDSTILREAVKAGEYDVREENSALGWATGYDIEAVKSGRLVKRGFRHERTIGMQALVFNTRRWPFKEWRVRRALAAAFDFEWTNRNIFYDQYVRSKSYFANSELAATGLPQGEELKILERLRGRIPDSVFTEEYAVPVYKGDGDIRSGLREAFRLFDEAGLEVRDFRMVEKASGRPLEFEVFTSSPEFTRIYLPIVANFKRMGVRMSVRIVDPSQYVKRIQQFDFDAFTFVFGQSDSPGNEQRNYWSSKEAKTPGSYNFIGIEDPAIDELVEAIIEADSREQLVARCRALDRVLLSHHFVIPQYYSDQDRLIYWDKFGVPAGSRRGAPQALTWWFDAAKAEKLRGRIRSMPATG